MNIPSTGKNQDEVILTLVPFYAYLIPSFVPRKMIKGSRGQVSIYFLHQIKEVCDSHRKQSSTVSCNSTKECYNSHTIHTTLNKIRP